MLNLSNLTSYSPPVPIAPLLPNFAFCHSAYGVGFRSRDALYAGGILPLGTRPVEYSITEEGGQAYTYTLPFEVSFGRVTITVETASPVEIKSMMLVPNDIRGMAAHLANDCVGARGTGGFMTKRIQGLVDFVTDPFSNLDAPSYPESAAFITLTLSTPEHAHSFPGDYDPVMALFLERVLGNALRRVQPPLHLEIADRIVRYTIQAERMRRLGTLSWWADEMIAENRTEILNRVLDEHPANESTRQTVTSRRVKTSSRFPHRRNRQPFLQL